MSTPEVMHAERVLRPAIQNLRSNQEAAEWNGIPQVLDHLANYFDEVVHRGIFEQTSDVQHVYCEAEDLCGAQRHTWSFGDSLKVVLSGPRFYFAPGKPVFSVTRLMSYKELTFLQTDIHTDVQRELDLLTKQKS